MTALLRAPLVGAAVAAVAIALVVQVAPGWGVALAFALGGTCAGLAAASVDRPRRLCWAAAAAVGLTAGVAALVGPLPAFDLRHAGPLDGLRELLAEPLRRLLPEPEGGVVRGILLGDRVGIDPDLRDAFARSGTAHLLAISGFNMTLVATGVALVARGRVTPGLTAAITVVSVVAYSVLVGLAPSVLRAALMACVASFALAFGRRAAITNALALAVAVMVALDASATSDVGFLLSATATAGLIYLAEPISARLRFLPRAVGEGVATTLAATIPTIPIIAGIFGRVSLVSPLANLFAVPLFPPLMLAGALTSVLGALSLDLARAPAVAVYVLAFLLRAVVEAAAALPLAALAVPDGTAAAVAYSAVVAVAICVGPRAVAGALSGVRPRLGALPTALRWPVSAPGARAARYGAAVLALALLLAVAGATWPVPSAMRVRALDVGQGDAFLVEISGRTMLIDGGPDPTRLLAELGVSLPPWSRRIDIVALTHAHADHANGLIEVFERYEVGLALEPVGLNPGAVASAWRERISSAGVPLRAVSAGTRMRIADASLIVLSPEGDPRVDVPSLVLRLERGGFSILFMGDATDQAQANLLLSPHSLATRVYVPPHHGATSLYSKMLVEAVRPSAALISVGARNRYGHPTADTLSALARVPVYRTDRHGTVELEFDGSKLVARTHANGLPPPRGRSIPYAPSAG